MICRIRQCPVANPQLYCPFSEPQFSYIYVLTRKLESMGLRGLFKSLLESKKGPKVVVEAQALSKREREVMHMSCCGALWPRASTGTSGLSSMAEHSMYCQSDPQVKSLCAVPCLFNGQATLRERHEFFCSLSDDFYKPHDICDWVTEEMARMSTTDKGEEKCLKNTIFTIQDGEQIFLKPNRPVLIAVSTIWTKEEDLDMFLEAAVIYDSVARTALTDDYNIEEEMLHVDISNRKQYLYPRLLFIIIGNGPESEVYKEQMKTLHLKRVAFRTLVPSTANCPILLASSDLGISLHRSAVLSSKVMDVMSKCGLPAINVSSYRSNTVSIKDQKPGAASNAATSTRSTARREDKKSDVLLMSADKLADHLQMFFEGFPDECDLLKLLMVDGLDIKSSV